MAQVYPWPASFAFAAVIRGYIAVWHGTSYNDRAA